MAKKNYKVTLKNGETADVISDDWSVDANGNLEFYNDRGDGKADVVDYFVPGSFLRVRTVET